MARQRLRPGTRAAAWLVTGPLGHLAGGVADWTLLLAGLGRDRVLSAARRAARARGLP